MVKSSVRRSKVLTILALVLALLLPFSRPRPASAFFGTVYVDAAATGGSNNGTSWQNAYTDLQTALGSLSLGDQVWVAAGTYVPGPSRSDSFGLLSSIAIYGGFGGWESQLSQRNPAANVTILSGEIGAPGNADNSYHVVTAQLVDSTAVLDGFTITAGNADGTTPDDEGGGMLITSASPTLRNLIISSNWAGNGAGLYDASAWNAPSKPTLTDITFYNNFATGDGGGMYDDGLSAPALTDVLFTDNEASTGGGGGLKEVGTGSLNNVTFRVNQAAAGGGLENWGKANVTNATFWGNYAAQPGAGGAIANGFAAQLVLTNVTVNGNATPSDGGGMESDSFSAASITNSIFWGDGGEFTNAGGGVSVSYSVIQGGCTSYPPTTCGSGNLLTDPRLGALANNGGYTQTMALQAGSSAIDTGTNSGCPATDQRGRPRNADGDQDGSAGCDIGAYEAPTFADLPVAGKEWMEAWVNAFYNAGITAGCGTNPLIYCPENDVTREEMAVFLLRAIHGKGYTPPDVTGIFADLPVPGKEWMEPWVDEFYNEGLTTGCATNPLRFCPTNDVTRQEMAVFILRALHGGSYSPPVTSGIFADMPVPGDEWMESWVDEFYNEGITTGCATSPLRYCPTNNVTRAEMAVFIDRAFHFYP